MLDQGSTGARSLKLRRFYAALVASQGGTGDPRIEAAFAAIPREAFVGPGPWSILAANVWRTRDRGPRSVATPDDDPAFLYQDVLVSLDAERRINIGQPSLHALCLDALALQPGETVIQVGAGSGYYTALLAHLVGPEGRVLGLEIDPDLAARAARNLAPWPWARVEPRSGVTERLPGADAIYVNAGTPRPARAWIRALRPGSRLLFPLQPTHGRGAMLLVRRSESHTAWPARFLSRAVFMPLQGMPEKDSARLAEAFARKPFPPIRSIRFDKPRDATCWYSSRGWWLSTKDP